MGLLVEISNKQVRQQKFVVEPLFRRASFDHNQHHDGRFNILTGNNIEILQHPVEHRVPRRLFSDGRVFGLDGSH